MHVGNGYDPDTVSTVAEAAIDRSRIRGDKGIFIVQLDTDTSALVLA